MKSKTFAVGIIILILGVLGFLLAQDVTSEYETTAGQLARGLSSEEQETYETWMGIKYGVALFGLIGFALTLYGGVAGNGEKEEVEKEKIDAQEEQEETDSVDKLEKLNKLKKEGVITEEEFEEKKKEVLEEV